MLCHVQHKSKALTAGKGVASTVSATSWLVPQHVKAVKRFLGHVGGLWFLGLVQLNFWFPGHPRLFGGLGVLHLLYFRMREATGLRGIFIVADVSVAFSRCAHPPPLSKLWRQLSLLRGLVSFRFMSDQANSPQTPVKVESHLKTDQETWKEPRAKV